MNAPTIPDAVRTWLARVIAALIAGAMTWLSRKGFLAVVLDADEQARLTEFTIITLTTLWGTYYGPLHKLINARINPNDGATPKLAKPGAEPFGEGARTRLGDHMQEVADGASVPETSGDPDGSGVNPYAPVVDDPERRAGWMARPPEARPTYEPLMMSVQTPSAETMSSTHPDTPPLPPKRKRTPRPPKPVTVPEPGAPQPDTAKEPPPAEFEP